MILSIRSWNPVGSAITSASTESENCQIFNHRVNTPKCFIKHSFTESFIFSVVINDFMKFSYDLASRRSNASTYWNMYEMAMSYWKIISLISSTQCDGGRYLTECLIEGFVVGFQSNATSLLSNFLRDTSMPRNFLSMQVLTEKSLRFLVIIESCLYLHGLINRCCQLLNAHQHFLHQLLLLYDRINAGRTSEMPRGWRSVFKIWFRILTRRWCCIEKPKSTNPSPT